METKCWFILVAFVVLCSEAKYKQKQYLSDEEIGTPEYDHDAFLGKTESDQFDQMSENESKMKLEELIEKIDKDQDQVITRQELKDWISFIQDKTAKETAKNLFDEYDTNKDEVVQWDEIEQKFNQGNDNSDSNAQIDNYSAAFIEREKMKFLLADQNHDQNCDIAEFMAYTHPEMYPYMSDYLMEETLGEMDKNNDSFVDENEYMSQFATNQNNGDATSDEELTEFKQNLDKDGDGKLSKEELKTYVMPDRDTQINEEVERLMSTIDNDFSDSLSKDEMLQHQDTLVGSQAVQYGELAGGRDEL